MRSKLSLNLDQLTVESFSTEARATPKGTVFGEQCTCYTNCTCPGCPSCDASCNGTCGTCGENTCQASCNGTCGDTCNCSGYTCDYCTLYDATCRNIGTCNWGAGPCYDTP